MGQFFGIEKIAQPTFGSGTITLPPSEFRIGGQGYRTTSNLTVSVGSPVSFTLYYVYAVISAGSPILVISTNVNSVGPATYTSWRLVGAYYSTGDTVPVFGSFVNITGVPNSGKISYLPVITGLGTCTGISGYVVRSGILADVQMAWTNGTPTAVTVQLSLPFTLSSTIAAGYNPVGIGTNTGAAPGPYAVLVYPGQSDFKIGLGEKATTGSGSPLTGTTAYMSVSQTPFMKALVPVSGWTNTQLIDL